MWFLPYLRAWQGQEPMFSSRDISEPVRCRKTTANRPAKNRAFRGFAIAPAPAGMRGQQTVLRKRRLQNRSAIFQVCLYGRKQKAASPAAVARFAPPPIPCAPRADFFFNLLTVDSYTKNTKMSFRFGNSRKRIPEPETRLFAPASRKKRAAIFPAESCSIKSGFQVSGQSSQIFQTRRS
jgi:hypothetical protein